MVLRPGTKKRSQEFLLGAAETEHSVLGVFLKFDGIDLLLLAAGLDGLVLVRLLLLAGLIDAEEAAADLRLVSFFILLLPPLHLYGLRGF